MISIPDSFWKKIKPIIPMKKDFRGRPASEPIRILKGIFYILRTGAQWRALPREFGAPSTVHGWFMKWARLGFFQQIFDLVREYYLSNNMENRWYAIDANHAKAPLAYFSGKSPVDRGKRGIKRTIVVDRKGAPIAISVGAGNAHDSQFFEETIKKLPKKKPAQILVADSAYDVKKFKRLCSKKNIAFVAATNRRRNQNLAIIKPLHRWIVERTFGWFSWYRALKTCWSKTKTSHEALFLFAASIQLIGMV
jgi:transposase